MITPFLEVTLISIGLSFLLAVIYRLLTKPGEMKKVKEDMKFFKEKMNQANKAGDKAKANEYASEMLKASQGQFRHSMKPMMVSMLVFLLLLTALNGLYGAAPVYAGSVIQNPIGAGQADSGSIILKGLNHTYIIFNESGVKAAAVDLDDDGSYSEAERFAEGSVFSHNGAYWSVSAAPKEGGRYVLASSILLAKLPFPIPYIGTYLTWFWWYVFLSVPGTLIFRKLLGVD